MQAALRSKEVQSTLLEQLIQSPKLPLYLKQLQEILVKEQQKREEFYQAIAETDKVEFINGEIWIF